jgi:hypothetical protein
MANRGEFASGVESTASSLRSRSYGRSGAVAVLAVVASLLLAACGGPSSPNVANDGTTTTTVAATNAGGGGSLASDNLAFAECMRAHGVANYPDPTSSGDIPKESLQQLGVSSSSYETDLNACKHLLPGGGNGPSPAQVAYETALGLSFAKCMRSHGVPLPDPDSSGKIPDPATLGINQGSPKFEAGNVACAKFRPPYMPSNAQYNAYVRSLG